MQKHKRERKRGERQLSHVEKETNSKHSREGDRRTEEVKRRRIGRRVGSRGLKWGKTCTRARLKTHERGGR